MPLHIPKSAVDTSMKMLAGAKRENMKCREIGVAVIPTWRRLAMAVFCGGGQSPVGTNLATHSLKLYATDREQVEHGISTEHILAFKQG